MSSATVFKRRENEKGLCLCRASLSHPTCIGMEAQFLPPTHRSNQVTYRLLTNYKVVPYDILNTVSAFQPNLITDLDMDFPKGLVRCPFQQR